jgi:hypothetical protein
MTFINLGKLFAFAGGIFVYMLACLWASQWASGDIYFGLAAFLVPVIIYAVWDQSKAEVEHELWKEERTIDALKREY